MPETATPDVEQPQAIDPPKKKRGRPRKHPIKEPTPEQPASVEEDHVALEAANQSILDTGIVDDSPHRSSSLGNEPLKTGPLVEEAQQSLEEIRQPAEVDEPRHLVEEPVIVPTTRPDTPAPETEVSLRRGLT
jgi:hypothetical protein